MKGACVVRQIQSCVFTKLGLIQHHIHHSPNLRAEGAAGCLDASKQPTPFPRGGARNAAPPRRDAFSVAPPLRRNCPPHPRAPAQSPPGGSRNPAVRATVSTRPSERGSRFRQAPSVRPAGRPWVSSRDMGKVRGLRARVHQAAVRPTGQAAPIPAPPAREAAPLQALSGGVGEKVSRVRGRPGCGAASGLPVGSALLRSLPSSQERKFPRLQKKQRANWKGTLRQVAVTPAPSPPPLSGHWSTFCL